MRWLAVAAFGLSGCALIAGDTGGNSCSACDGEFPSITSIDLDCPPGSLLGLVEDPVCTPSEPPRCPAGQRAEADACRAIARADCADGWPAAEADAYVQTGARDGDGSRERPFGTLSEALATDATIIAVHAGEYDGCVTLSGERTLVGACGQTVITNGECAIEVAADAVVSLDDLRLVGERGVEVATTATLTLSQSSLSRLRSSGSTNALSSRLGTVTVDRGSLTLMQTQTDGVVEVENAQLSGNDLVANGELRVTDSIVRGARWWLIGGDPALDVAGGEVQLSQLLVSDATRGLVLRSGVRSVIVDTQLVTTGNALTITEAFAAAEDLALLSNGTEAIRVEQGTLDVSRGRIAGGFDLGLYLLRPTPVGAGSVTLNDVVIQSLGESVGNGVRVAGGTFLASQVSTRASGVAFRIDGAESALSGGTAVLRGVDIERPQVGLEIGSIGSISAGRVEVEFPSETAVRVAPGGALIAACLQLTQEDESAFAVQSALEVDRESFVDVSEIEILGSFECGVRLLGPPPTSTAGPANVNLTCGSIQRTTTGICLDRDMEGECPERPDGLTRLFFSETNDDQACPNL